MSRKILFCIFFSIASSWAACLDDNVYFECSIDDNFCHTLYFSGCTKDWKLDSLVINSLKSGKRWLYDYSKDKFLDGIVPQVIEVNFNLGDSVQLEIYSSYGVWGKKMIVEDPYTTESQYIPDDE